MKKVIIFLLTIFATLFTTLAIADANVNKNTIENTVNFEKQKSDQEMINSLLSSSNISQADSTENIQVMSNDSLEDTKGGVTGPYVCIECGGRHGGVYSPYFCQWCFIKLK